MIVLRQTDLPAPVAPATRRCGILQRSPNTGRPVMSLPSAIQSGGTWPRFGIASRISRIATTATVLIRNLDADGRFSGNRRLDAHAGCGQRERQIVGERGDPRDLDAALGLQLVARDRRSALDVRDLRADAEARQRIFENVRAIRVVDRLRSAARRRAKGRAADTAPEWRSAGRGSVTIARRLFLDNGGARSIIERRGLDVIGCGLLDLRPLAPRGRTRQRERLAQRLVSARQLDFQSRSCGTARRYAGRRRRR